MGSARVVVQGTTVVEAYDYDPWGVRLDGRTVAGATREGFTTKERDAESGLDYFGARYYMAALGRWTSVDPLSDQFVEWSPYTYTFDSPSSAIDPLGLEPESVVLTGQDAQDYFRRLQSRTASADSKKCPPCGEEETQGANRPGRRSAVGRAAGTFVAFGLRTTAVLAADDVTGVGTLDDVLIPLLFAGVSIAAAVDYLDRAVPRADKLEPREGFITVTHFTSVEGADAIMASGALRSGSFVTLPSQVAGMRQGEVEAALEIAPGRAAVSTTFRTPISNLVTPFNGPVTSGGKIQYQLARPVPISRSAFVPTPK